MIQIVILAAGQGKRMQSQLPKVLHRLAGKPILAHVIQTTIDLLPESKPIVVIGHQGERLQETLSHYAAEWVVQTEQRGTAHALEQALPHLPSEDHVLVLCGDAPLISAMTLHQLISTTPANAMGMLTATVAQPFGYGRIKRDAQHRIQGIVEERDATVEEKKLTEINPGVYYIPVQYLKKWLPQIKNNNDQGEYYLTDIIALAVQDKVLIHTTQPLMTEEILGVNDRVQLATLERFYQRQMAERFMRAGVTLCDPARFDVRGDVQIGRDVVIDINVILEGKVVIGDHCVIGANSILRDTQLGSGVNIKPHTLIEGAIIAADCTIGPFARIRPETRLDEQVHVGNFVEIKKSHVAAKSKINHLSYIGDSQVGRQVNIGAGTITCNYDGVNKHKTRIEDHVSVGAGTQLVAPVEVGKGATIGAGSTITENVAAETLVIARARQQVVSGWKRKEKKE